MGERSWILVLALQNLYVLVHLPTEGYCWQSFNQSFPGEDFTEPASSRKDLVNCFEIVVSVSVQFGTGVAVRQRRWTKADEQKVIGSAATQKLIEWLQDGQW